MHYAKAIVGALIAGLGALSTALTTNAPGEATLTGGEIVVAVIAFLTGLSLTALVPNAGFLNLDKFGVTEQDVRRALAARRVSDG
jgi:hypothetical protein